MTPFEFDLKCMLKNSDGETRQVHFSHYRDGALWYRTESGLRPDGVIQPGFDFPVPISDIGNATFFSSDRAPLFMRYIRKHLELLKETWEDQQKEVAEIRAILKDDQS